MPHRHAVILLSLIILGVVGGTFCGWYFGQAMERIAWLGTLFLNALKMLILPLIIAAVVSGVASLGDVRKLGKLGGVTVLYFVITTGIAVFIGLVLVNVIQPGVGLTLEGGALPEQVTSKASTGVGDILLSMISPNLFTSAAHMQLLPIIIFAILLSAALTTIGSKGEHVIAFFDGLNEALMKVVIWVMYFAPIGIFALVAARLGKAGGGDAFYVQLSAVGWHVTTVLCGLTLHFIVLTFILLLIARRKMGFIGTLLRALLTAFSTASSSATLPLTMECLRENKVEERAIRFVVPLGATVNMNGTALYEAEAALFIAQAYDIHLSLGQQVIVFITATLAAIGAAGIPEAGLVTMVIVLSAVGLPLEGVSLLLAVDWFLDRFRTSINVFGDAVGAAVVQRFLPASTF
jgi:Na+/H+-dicarboxylate symporter